MCTSISRCGTTVSLLRSCRWPLHVGDGLFLVTCTVRPSYDPARAGGAAGWTEHAAFMDGWSSRFVVSVGRWRTSTGGAGGRGRVRGRRTPQLAGSLARATSSSTRSSRGRSASTAPGARLARSADVGDQLAQQVEHAAGPGPRGRQSASAFSSSEAEQTAVRVALATQLLDGAERLDVTEVVADEGDRLGAELLDEPVHGRALVHAVGADLDHVAAGLDVEVVGLGRLVEQRQQSFVRRLRVLEPAGVHGDREPLLLDPGLVGLGRGGAAAAARP